MSDPTALAVDEPPWTTDATVPPGKHPWSMFSFFEKLFMRLLLQHGMLKSTLVSGMIHWAVD